MTAIAIVTDPIVCADCLRIVVADPDGLTEAIIHDARNNHRRYCGRPMPDPDPETDSLADNHRRHEWLLTLIVSGGKTQRQALDLAGTNATAATRWAQRHGRPDIAAAIRDAYAAERRNRTAQSRNERAAQRYDAAFARITEGEDPLTVLDDLGIRAKTAYAWALRHAPEMVAAMCIAVNADKRRNRTPERTTQP